MSGAAADSLQRQPLAARRVIVTRPLEQALTWVAALQERGIDAVAAPLLDIAAAPDTDAVDAVWSKLSQWTLLVFVSPNAVAQFFARRPAGCDWPDALDAAVPGPGSSAVLRANGLRDDQIVEPAADAANFDSESLWLRLQHRDWHATRVLIVRGESGRDWLAARLREAGAEVGFVCAYRRAAAVLPEPTRQMLRRALAEPADHLWFFSSSEAVGHLLQAGLLPAGELEPALAQSAALATHPRIAERARAAGFARIVESRPGLDDVVACIQSGASLDLPSASRSSL